jgi:hypothetical protein
MKGSGSELSNLSVIHLRDNYHGASALPSVAVHVYRLALGTLFCYKIDGGRYVLLARRPKILRMDTITHSHRSIKHPTVNPK